MSTHGKRFLNLLGSLKEEHRAALKERGITRMMLYGWRKAAEADEPSNASDADAPKASGGRLPTEVQVADLADITGFPWAELQGLVTVLRAPADRKREIARIVRAK
jgi:hypothetical protein